MWMIFICYMCKDNFQLKAIRIIYCLFCSSCRYQVSDEKRVDIISDIAEIVNDNYTIEDKETPLYISITVIDELAGESSDLHATIEKYDDVKEYRVYLLDNNMVLVITDVLFQEREGYLISEEKQEGVLIVSGMSFDSDMIRIKSRIGDSNTYTFSAGQ